MMREQARVIATQHAYWKRHGCQIRAKNPVSFEKWFLLGIRRQEKKGAEFTFLCPGLVRISWPGKPAMLRTLADFEREFDNDYLSHF
jgi:hypothetical protein